VSDNRSPVPVPVPVPAPATMTQSGRRFLKALAAQASSGCFLEVGPLFGSSTQAIDAGRQTDAVLHTVDTFEPADWIERRLGRQLSREAFDHYTSYIDKLVVHHGFAPDIVRDSWSEPIGFYFDDATHVDPGWTDNFNFFSKFFTDDAIICGDDFAGGWPDITTNVSRIAADWDVGLYVFGRVWAITRRDEDRIVAAATDAEPVLVGATLESAHGLEIDTCPAMVWTRGLHQHVPLSAFRFDGGVAKDVRFEAAGADGTAVVGPGEWLHVPGIIELSFTGPSSIGFQLCLSADGKTWNTKLHRQSKVCRIPEGAVPVSVRLGTI
jgi:hypothetical protein